MKLPKIKTKNIVVQNLDSEVLIYDLNTNQAFCLNETSAKVFNHCDGVQTFAQLKEKYQFTDEIIYLSLDALKEKNLLTEEYASPLAGMSRREVIRKVGLATMIALPVISSIVAPTAANAASGCQTSGYIGNATSPGPCSQVSITTAIAACNTSYGSKCCSGKAQSAGAVPNTNPCQIYCTCA